MTSHGETFRALRVRNFRVYFIGQTISTIGTWMQMLAQAWLVLDLTGSGSSLGITAMLQTLPIALLIPYGGVIADRVDRRLLVATTSVLGAAQAIALGVLTATDHITVHWIWVFAVLLGVVGAFERPAMQAMLFDLAGPDDLTSAVGLNAMIMSTGRLIGPAVAGVVIAASGIAPCFLLNAATFVAMLVALVLVRTAEMHRTTRSIQRPKLREGLAYVWSHPDLRHALAVMFVVGTFAYNFATTMPSMVRFVFHADAGTLGFAQSTNGFGATIGAYFVASRVKPTRQRFGVVAIVFGVAIAVAALAPNGWTFVALCMPLGAASALFSTTDQLVLQEGTDGEFQGRVMGLFSLAWLGTTPIGAVIVGWTIEHVSARAAMGLGAASALVCGIVTLLVPTRDRASGNDVAVEALA
ncbi:MAG: MFS transporter [Acidimicrobiia bacterium]